MVDQELRVAISSMRYPGDSVGNLIEALSFTAYPASIVSFLGRSGVGKTTLMRIIAGLERRYEGEVRLGNHLVARPGRNIQIVFQDIRLLPWKTVYENVKFAINPKANQDYELEIDKWLTLVGLKNKRNAWPKTLSGGEENRLAFARAFIDCPNVLLLDEPFRNLDLVTRFHLQDELLRHLTSRKTIVLLISHNIEEAVYLSDVVHVLSGAPMTIQATYNVGIERPRSRTSSDVTDIVTEITKRMTQM